jgi:2-polyprenyl-3-methyl-5-hydroxy-6-metoxy-1,4-benzoquinol methylase
MEQINLSPQDNIWKLCLGFANTSVLYALIKSGVIEELRNDPKTLDELVYACGLDPDVLYRTLRFAIIIDVIKLADGKYILTEVGKLLLKDVPGSVYYGLLLVGSEPWQKAWQNFIYSLTIGENSFESVMRTPFFDFLNQHPRYATPYHEWMTASTNLASKAITEAYDFSSFKSVCDIGGGQGILLKNILTENPHLQGILFDLESVVETHLLSEMDSKAKIQAGNFFDKVPKADVLILKSVLHYWNDEKSIMILKNCRKVMDKGSRLLIIEMTIESPTDIIGAFYDLNMQILLNGKERTEDEFNQLLLNAELKLNRVISTESTLRIFEAVI